MGLSCKKKGKLFVRSLPSELEREGHQQRRPITEKYSLSYWNLRSVAYVYTAGYCTEGFDVQLSRDRKLHALEMEASGLPTSGVKILFLKNSGAFTMVRDTLLTYLCNVESLATGRSPCLCNASSEGQQQQ